MKHEIKLVQLRRKERSHNFQDISGQRFGKLTVIGLHHINNSSCYWLCKCDCGNEKVVRGGDMKRGKINSCGCIKREKTALLKYKHGECHSRLYVVWQRMKDRCLKPSCPNYKNYGGRGITICDEWINDFGAFYGWAMANGYDEGANKFECTIERIDVNGNYEPSNCKWANWKEQSRNRRDSIWITYNDKTHCLIEWANITNHSYGCLLYRYHKGWSYDEMFTIPQGVSRREWAKNAS